MSDTLERVTRKTAEVLKVAAEKITPASRFVEDLGAESVQSIELIAAFEEEFELEFEEEAALNIKTVGDAVGFIEKELAELEG